MNDQEEAIQKQISDLAGDNLEAGGVVFLKSREGKTLDLLRSVGEKLEETKDEGGQQRRSLLKELGACMDQLEELAENQKSKKILNKEKKLESQLSALKGEIEKLEERADDRDEVVKTLREESGQLRDDFIYEERIEPGAQVIIGLRDNVLGQLSDLVGNESMRVFLEAADSQLRKALARFGIDEVEAEGDDFDPSMQKTVETEETLEKHRDRKVVEILRPGYRRDDELVRPQKVKIAKFGGGEDEQ